MRRFGRKPSSGTTESKCRKICICKLICTYNNPRTRRYDPRSVYTKGRRLAAKLDKFQNGPYLTYWKPPAINPSPNEEALSKTHVLAIQVRSYSMLDLHEAVVMVRGHHARAHPVGHFSVTEPCLNVLKFVPAVQGDFEASFFQIGPHELFVCHSEKST